MRQDRVDNAGQLVGALRVPKPQNRPTLSAKESRSPFIAGDLRRLSMTWSIKLDYKLGFGAGEVGDKRSNRMLAPELQATRALSEQGPDLTFRSCGVTA